MTVQDIAKHLRMSWNTIKEIDKEYLERHFNKPSLKDVRYLAIDEFAVSKGHTYQTIVIDVENMDILFIGDGRRKDSLDPFWKRLKRSGAKIQAVAMDMWVPYFESVMTHIPKAKIVLDHFHIIKNMNRVIDDIRRLVYHTESDILKRKVIKGTRWLLLKNPENLSDVRDEKIRLQEALKLNEPLAMAYYLKEELRMLWSCKSKREAEMYLESWRKKVYATSIGPLIKFANSLSGHRSAILNWFDHKISTGPLEGINNKIKVLKRKAYGFRDMEYLN